jgi:multiple sugar transport system substrate-binding protein
MNRRTFLTNTARTAAAGAAGALWPSGCAPRPDPGAVVLRGWAYEPDLVRVNLNRIRKREPGLRIDYAPISGNYHDKMVALFLAKTDLDLLYVRDDHFASWVEAGWLRPVDDLPGAGQYSESLYPFNREAMSYRGKLYGLPYYGDFSIWVWHRRMLEEAGFDHCGRTLDEVTEQCIKLKERGVRGTDGAPIEFPITLGFKQAPLGFNDYWALNYASEATLFTEDLDPIFPDDPERKAERILQWVVDGIHRHRIVDLESSFSTPIIADLFAGGRLAMCSISKYDLQRLNDPARSEAAGDTLMAPLPSLEPHQIGTIGWTRMYCLAAHSRHVDDAWHLMNLLGGRDEEGFTTARFWYLERGLGFAFPELLDDPEIAESTRKWADVEQVRELAAHARAREVVKAPWFAEFDTFYQAEIQGVLLKHRSPRDGLANIAARCRRLRAAWT